MNNRRQQSIRHHIRTAALSSFFCLGLPAFAHQPANGTIHAAVGGFNYLTHELHHGFHSPVMSGPGIVADGDIDRHGGLEVSVFYMRSIYSVREQDKVLTEQTKRMYIGLGYRHWFDTRLSIAGAFTSAYSMGDARILRDDFGSGPRPGTSARDITEYGIEASVQFEPYSYKNVTLLLDGRYNYSLTAKHGEDANHYGVLVALKFFIQSHEKPLEDEDDL